MAAITDPVLAFHPASVNDWTLGEQFINKVKTGRFWRDENNDFVSDDICDANFWLTSLPTGDYAKMVWSTGSYDPWTPGDYVLRYTGEGTITVTASGGSLTITDTSAGRIEFTYSSGPAIFVEITETDPNANGEYIRDIEICRADYEYLLDLGEVFSPDWLALVQDARQLRFMKWQLTETSTETDWADRSLASFATYTRHGVPLSVIIDLCNQIGCDPYLCLPYLASDDYIQEFAAYVRDNLNAGLVAYYAWANEVWNGSYAVNGWAYTQAQSDWGETANAMDKLAERTVNMAQQIDTAYSTTKATRTKHKIVIEGQTADPSKILRSVTGSNWELVDAENFVDPTTLIDCIACSSYFGQAVLANSSYRSDLIDQISTVGSAAAQAWLKDQLLDESYDQSIPYIAGQWNTIRGIADDAGLDLILYEGGQHVFFDASGVTTQQWDILTPVLQEFVHSDLMRDLYAALYDAWKLIGDGPFMIFTEFSVVTSREAYGLYAPSGGSNPRASYLVNKNETDSAWFGDGGGARYLPSIKMVASAASDVLTGNGLNDVLVGIDPDNVAVLPGSRADYTIAKQEDGSITLAKDGNTARVKSCGCIVHTG